MDISREKAVELFKKYNKSESLYHHALSVEAVMREFAGKNNEDQDFWDLLCGEEREIEPYWGVVCCSVSLERYEQNCPGREYVSYKAACGRRPCVKEDEGEKGFSREFCEMKEAYRLSWGGT